MTTSDIRHPTSDIPAEPLLRIHDLGVSFDNGSGPRIQAVDGARMSVYPGQTLAVVGESGCGKSVTAMSALQLIPRPPGRFDRGQIFFQSTRVGGNGEEVKRRRGEEVSRRPDTLTSSPPHLFTSSSIDLLALPESDIRRVRGNEIAMIFQEPMTSLNPVYTVGDQIMEAVLLHQPVTAAEARETALAAMRDVGIPEPERRIRQYPHQFSGGMRQRVMIAMALACRPKLLLADEPTTALDVTIQAQILELLRSLQRSRGMAIMLITHALGVVAENADVVCVMYAGRVVEYATVFDLFDNPLHPYTRGLLASIPKVGERKDRLVTIREVVENPAEFQKLPGADKGIRPWWPWHQPPADLAAAKGGGPAGDYHLREVSPGHWVGLWRTRAVADEESAIPDLTFTRQPATP